MNQTGYAESLVAQYGISTNPNIPGSPGVDLGSRKDGEPGGNDEFPLYQPLVGSLMLLSVMTRPDIADALRACARHINNPSPPHWKALLQITTYVREFYEMYRSKVCARFWPGTFCVCRLILITRRHLMIEGSCLVWQ